MLRSPRVLHTLSAIAVVGLLLGGVNYVFFQKLLLGGVNYVFFQKPLLGGVNYAFFQKPLLASNDQITFPFPVLEPQKETCPYDLETDISLQKYLSDDTPFADRSYVPSDLQKIDSHFTANDSTRYQLRQEAAIQFADMARKFWHDFDGDRLSITSAYRSSSFQNYLLHTFCKKDQCATPGTSEHQAGLAIDLGVRTKKGGSKKIDQGNIYYDWFVQNAYLYGFHNTYQRGVDVDGKMVEGRHRRYMGTGLATVLHDDNQSFAERMNSGANQIACPSLHDILYK